MVIKPCEIVHFFIGTGRVILQFYKKCVIKNEKCKYEIVKLIENRRCLTVNFKYYINSELQI